MLVMIELLDGMIENALLSGGTIDDLKSDKILYVLVTKWNEWVKLCKNCSNMPLLPFTPNELDYLCSPLLDALKDVQLQSYDNVFVHACRTNSRKIIDFILCLNRKIKYHYDNELPFRSACAYGNLDMAKWLYEEHKVNFSINKHDAFNQACLGGHLHVVKWLVSLYISAKTQVSVEPQISIGESFRYACENGHLELAKYLYELTVQYNTTFIFSIVDILGIRHEVYVITSSFTRACCNGHLDVAQWLKTKFNWIDPAWFCHEPFRSACINGHLEVAMWIHSITNNSRISKVSSYVIGELLDHKPKLTQKVHTWLKTLLPIVM